MKCCDRSTLPSHHVHGQFAVLKMFVAAALALMDTLLSVIADIPLQLCPASVVSSTGGMSFSYPTPEATLWYKQYTHCTDVLQLCSTYLMSSW